MTREKYGREYEGGSVRTIRFLVSRGVPSDTAEDVAQSAWLLGWERISQLRDESMLTTWINTIALNTFRRVAFRARLFTSLRDTPWANPSVNEAAIEVFQLLKRCRSEDRILLEEQMAGSTCEESALKHGVSTVAIRLRFLRARRAAKQCGQKSS